MKTALVCGAVLVRTINQSVGCRGLRSTQTSKKLLRAGCAGGTRGDVQSVASRDRLLVRNASTAMDTIWPIAVEFG